MRPIWWPKLIPHYRKHKLYRKNIEDFLLNVVAYKPFDERAFVPYRSVGFMSRNRRQVKGQAHVLRSVWQISAERGRVDHSIQRRVDSPRVSRSPVVPRH
jgi:hypothetical protein